MSTLELKNRAEYLAAQIHKVPHHDPRPDLCDIANLVRDLAAELHRCCGTTIETNIKPVVCGNVDHSVTK